MLPIYSCLCVCQSAYVCAWVIQHTLDGLAEQRAEQSSLARSNVDYVVLDQNAYQNKSGVWRRARLPLV